MEDDYYEYSDELRIKIELMQSLFQKSGKYLENIGFRSNMRKESKHKLLELINNCCVKNKFLDLKIFSIQSVNLALGSIKNIKQNLNYLAIKVYDYFTS